VLHGHSRRTHRDPAHLSSNTRSGGPRGINIAPSMCLSTPHT
jgi:hypothetical protein